MSILGDIVDAIFGTGTASANEAQPTPGVLQAFRLGRDGNHVECRRRRHSRPEGEDSG